MVAAVNHLHAKPRIRKPPRDHCTAEPGPHHQHPDPSRRRRGVVPVGLSVTSHVIGAGRLRPQGHDAVAGLVWAVSSVDELTIRHTPGVLGIIGVELPQTETA